MSVEKQLAMNFRVNNVPIPMELIRHIKSYAFIDQTTAFIRQKKREIATLFENAVYSRKNTSRWVTESSETWIFLCYYEDTKYFQVASGNCSMCGDYFIGTNHKLLCRCPHQNHQMDDFDEQWNLDDDFDDDPGADYP
jgi:hypothetical protein